MAGCVEIEASVRPGMNGTGSLERLVLATTANLQRADMNPVDKAHAFQNLLDAGMSQAEVAQAVGLSVASISNYLLILRANTLIQNNVASGALPADANALRALMAIEDQALQYAVVRGAAVNKLPASGVIALARRMQNGKKASKKMIAKAKARDELHATWAGKWNMIAQAGNPHIESADLHKAAVETCQACALFLGASPKVCRDCPAVDLLRKFLGINQGK
jgi:ParB-like chromosome segregation protein Spo0J